MDDRIRILFYNRDGAGVNYFRTLTPAMQLERNHSDKFYVEINPDLDYNDLEGTIKYLKSFHIIHYHRSMTGNATSMLQLANELRKAGVVLIADIDDYWELPKQHPFYSISREKKLHLDVMDNLKIADYVTTTTDLFAETIRKVTGKDNVIVLPNSVDPTWMKQFQNNWKPDKNGLLRLTYMAGSSHRGDIEQLNGTFNILDGDNRTKNKFKTIIAGWDTEGKTTDIRFNQEFGAELQKRGVWTKDMVKAINKSGGNIDLIPNVPTDMVERYRDKVFFKSERSIKSEESVYLQYELIFTDNYNIIKNEDYLAWLKKYERDMYPDEGYFARRWTQKANIYAKVLDETDVSIAPLSDNTFNRMKSNLKQVECWSRKLPIVCTDIPPYNVDGVHMKNCLLVPNKKRNERDWAKAFKKLITEPNLREDLGNQLYEDFKDKYHLKNVTNNRAEFYESAVFEMNKI